MVAALPARYGGLSRGQGAPGSARASPLAGGVDDAVEFF
jgi:hypothetical protein